MYRHSNFTVFMTGKYLDRTFWDRQTELLLWQANIQTEPFYVAIKPKNSCQRKTFKQNCIVTGTHWNRIVFVTGRHSNRTAVVTDTFEKNCFSDSRTLKQNCFVTGNQTFKLNSFMTGIYSIRIAFVTDFKTSSFRTCKPSNRIT